MPFLSFTRACLGKECGQIPLTLSISILNVLKVKGWYSGVPSAACSPGVNRLPDCSPVFKDIVVETRCERRLLSNSETSTALDGSLVLSGQVTVGAWARTNLVHQRAIKFRVLPRLLICSAGLMTFLVKTILFGISSWRLLLPSAPKFGTRSERDVLFG